MTTRTWAEKKVEEYGMNVPDIGRMIYKETGVALLMAEHARAVQIVKQYYKRYGTEGSPCELICNDILAALQRGRTRGK